MTNIERVCLFPDCTKPQLAKGLCSGHYSQQYRGGPLTTLQGHAGRRPYNWLRKHPKYSEGEVIGGPPLRASDQNLATPVADPDSHDRIMECSQCGLVRESEPCGHDVAWTGQVEW